jgi:hypothetical protein
MKLLEIMILNILVLLLVGALIAPTAVALISHERDLRRQRQRMRLLIRSLVVYHAKGQFPGPASRQVAI